jgi:hypothetical protein
VPRLVYHSALAQIVQEPTRSLGIEASLPDPRASSIRATG